MNRGWAFLSQRVANSVTGPSLACSDRGWVLCFVFVGVVGESPDRADGGARSRLGFVKPPVFWAIIRGSTVPDETKSWDEPLRALLVRLYRHGVSASSPYPVLVMFVDVHPGPASFALLDLIDC
ncbi:hypothetical protein VNO77_19177 [Canavalia gladiata]|uniref:Uncharacterized protein n=1 Tax=Canavalia gladiata TaxID=3824 RepID=A0AAN9LQW3_CANGL